MTNQKNEPAKQDRMQKLQSLALTVLTDLAMGSLLLTIYLAWHGS